MDRGAVDEHVTDRMDFCITTFKRPHALRALLRSVAAYYPRAAVYVADQNETFDSQFYDDVWRELSDAGLERRPSVEQMEFDCGISAARNRLVESTPREYKLILDDDFLFTEETSLESFVLLVEADPDVGVVGGVVKCDDSERRFDFKIQREGTVLRQIPGDGPFRESGGIRYRQTDCVLNFALMKKDLFTCTRWDPELKVGEHLAFYVGITECPYTVLFTPDVVIDHQTLPDSAGYAAYRHRQEFFVKAFHKLGLTRVETVGGLIVELNSERSLTVRSAASTVA